MDPAVMRDKKKNAGFTLVEIIVSIVLIGIVFTMAGMFLNFSFKAEKKVENEYELQAEVRKATEALNNSIRNSSVTFIIPESVFKEPKKEKWNYFGLEDSKQIVQYIWNPSTSTHDKRVIVEARDGITYNLFFKQNKKGSKLVEFELDVISKDRDSKSISVSTELAALNSIAVDDGGSVDNPAVAVAYRSDPAPRPEEVTTRKEVTIAISLVLDDSGSMDYDMNGRQPGDWYFNSSQVRKTIMKNEAKKLIDQFAGLGNIKVSIIPFSTTANNPGEILDTALKQTELKNKINGLDAYGGTNTGDGLRRAYYKLKSYKSDHPSDEIVNYIILLTDGDPTYYSGDTTKSSNYNNYKAKLGDGNCGDQYVWGEGNNDGYGGATNLTRSMSYVSVIGNRIKGDTSMDIGTYVIGFSAVSDDISNNRTIAENYCNGKYYVAGSAIELENTFQEITTKILQETWHIYGPY